MRCAAQQSAQLHIEMTIDFEIDFLASKFMLNAAETLHDPDIEICLDRGCTKAVYALLLLY